MKSGIGLVLLVCGLLLSCATNSDSVIIGPHVFGAEIADAPDEWSQGLMFREQLGINKGMLFIFPDDAPRSFWMKNTKIPLDMIFINESRRIVYIHQNVQPCIKDPCPAYPSPPAMYVFEINAGLAKEYGFGVGDAVRIDYKSLASWELSTANFSLTFLSHSF
ncbi:DUF192 domain-containing protein [Candidatus Woesearchaeota archaeon]|nr:DUF192 domain-containing protein [Candidatus Woesearchaeota archaeon]